MSKIDFNEIKQNIQESVKDCDFNCPKCKSANTRMSIQSLCYNKELGAMIDVYGCKCFDCNEYFNVQSKPLKHFKGLGENFKPNVG